MFRVKPRSFGDRQRLMLWWDQRRRSNLCGALLGSLWDEDEGTKIASHSVLVTSDKVRASPPTLESTTDPRYTSQQRYRARIPDATFWGARVA